MLLRCVDSKTPKDAAASDPGRFLEMGFARLLPNVEIRHWVRAAGAQAVGFDHGRGESEGSFGRGDSLGLG